MLKFRFLFFLGFSFTIVNAQLISEVRKSFYSTAKDRLKNAEILRDYYLDEAPDSIYNISSFLFRKGFEKENLNEIMYAKLIISSYYYEHGKADESIENLRECILFYERKHDLEKLAHAQNMMGLALMHQLKTKEAISWFLKSLKSAQNLPEENEAYMAQMSLVEAFYRLEQYDSAEKELEAFIKKVKKRKLNKALRKAYQLKAKICFATNRADEAVLLSEKSLSLAYQNGDKLGLSFAKNDVAIAYFQKGNEAQALAAFKESLKLRKELGNSTIICESYFNLGEIYYFKELYSQAIQYYDSSYNLGLKNNLLNEQVDALERIGECYSKLNQAEKAYKFMVQFALSQRKLISQIKKDDAQIDDDLKAFRNSEQEMNQSMRERELVKRIEKAEFNSKMILVFAILICSLLLFFTLKVKSRKDVLAE